MKLLANLLIWASLVIGLISTITAYVPRVDSAMTAASSDAPLTLNAAAGISPETSSEFDLAQPLIDPDADAPEPAENSDSEAAEAVAEQATSEEPDPPAEDDATQSESATESEPGADANDDAETDGEPSIVGPPPPAGLIDADADADAEAEAGEAAVDEVADVSVDDAATDEGSTEAASTEATSTEDAGSADEPTAGSGSDETADGDDSAGENAVAFVPERTEAGDIALTSDVLTHLKDADVERVRVREFSFMRWDGKWLFLVSVIGLIAGAVLMRRANAAAAAALAGDESGTRAGDGSTALRAAHQEAVRLLAEVEPLGELEANRAIIRGVDHIKNEYLDVFVADRTDLINRLGMSGYAQLMDRFAGAERELHRAWSAAADQHHEEAMRSLRSSAQRFGLALERLPQ